jgi:non-ribosomal peptide synthetase component E (peptide arylation enzyme)
MNSFTEVVRRHAGNQPDRTALTLLADGETQEINLTYGELDKQARTIAATLQSRTVPGERVLLLLELELEFLAAFLGCLYAGVIACGPRDSRSGGWTAVADHAEGRLRVPGFSLCRYKVFSRCAHQRCARNSASNLVGSTSVYG